MHDIRGSIAHAKMLAVQVFISFHFILFYVADYWTSRATETVM
jgi:hypothetical protein